MGVEAKGSGMVRTSVRKEGCHSSASSSSSSAGCFGRSMGQEMLGSPGVGRALVVLAFELIFGMEVCRVEVEEC